MRSREHAELLLRKAAEHQFVVEKLSSDPASRDEVIGFHAQQSVEKTRKSALTLSSVHYGRTHSIAALIDLLAENRIAFPSELDQVRRLTPFAVAFRYDELPPQPQQPFDRLWALDCVRQVRTWAESLLRKKREGQASGRPT
jgi:HEPN domain-containing protein